MYNSYPIQITVCRRKSKHRDGHKGVNFIFQTSPNLIGNIKKKALLYFHGIPSPYTVMEMLEKIEDESYHPVGLHCIAL